MFRKLTPLIAAGLVTAAASSAQAQYFEVYGGSSLGGQDLNYGPMPPSAPNLQQMDPGIVFGAGYYVPISSTAFQLGGDVMLTDQDYSTWGPGSNLSSASLMINGRYTFQAFGNFQGYLGAGLGGINLTYDDPAAFLDGSSTIAGYQLEGGLVYDLGAYTTFVSMRYQAGFDEAIIQSESVEYNSTSILAGIRF